MNNTQLTLEDIWKIAENLIRERDNAIRERDEAREALRTLAEHGENEIQKLIKECDEARNKMADALQEVDLRTLDYERMKQERDQAREENKKLREVLEWISKRYDDSKPTHAVAMDCYEMSCTARAVLQKEETK